MLARSQPRFRFRAPPWSPGFAIDAAGSSRGSPRHPLNEDAFLISDSRKLVVVADGMGGTRGARTASRCAVEHLSSALQAVPDGESVDKQLVIAAVQAAFLDANRHIVAHGQSDAKLFGMGTTAVIGMVRNGRLYIASLGDSRAYLLRADCLWQYTVDHTMAQALVASGVISMSAARRHRWRHRLWKYLGRPDLTEGPEVSAIRVEAGDRALFVTDGVTAVLDRHALGRVAGAHGDAARTAHAVVTAAATAGSTDDITCVAVHFDACPAN